MSGFTRLFFHTLLYVVHCELEVSETQHETPLNPTYASFRVLVTTIFSSFLLIVFFLRVLLHVHDLVAEIVGPEVGAVAVVVGLSLAHQMNTASGKVGVVGDI